MKHPLLLLILFMSLVSYSQTPQFFKYQAVVRDAAGLLAVNRIVSIRTSILAGSATGSSVYSETQTLSTNDYGVVSLNIGNGTLVSGSFSTINWSLGNYFVKNELDITGGSTYVFMGTSQLVSVPYALYSEKSGNSISDHDTSATNEIQTLSVSGNSLSVSGGNTVSLPPDADSNPTNELQILSITGDSLHITNGNSVYLSGAVDLDANPTNELQNLNLQNDTLSISSGNYVVFPNDSDTDSTNEIQSISINNDTISLSNSNSIVIPQISIAGTANQINVSNVLSNYTLSTPQDISTTSSPTFSGITLSPNPLNLSSGGTNAQLLPISGGIVYSNASQLQITPSGTAGQYLTSNASGTPLWTNPPTTGNMFVASSITGDYTAGGASKAAANEILISPLYIPAPITVNFLKLNVTQTLGATGDVGVYDSNLNLVLNGGSGSLAAAVGLQVVTPIQLPAARTLAPGQYYVAVTYNAYTGRIGCATLGVTGMIRRSGFATGGGSVLPATITSITDGMYLYGVTLSNN